MGRLSEFIGLYIVERDIDDRKAGVQLRFEGRAVLSMSPSGAIYSETGVLNMGGKRFESERNYLWHEEGARICVRFADGRDFHIFDPVVGGPVTAHLCGADIYCGCYDLSGWPRWSVTWEVSGPRKNYLSVTTYVLAN
ncbi:MAG: DUF6314 family protein [Octadecabacter sp.]|nr:DUF6314 family protein [Octadecabacter sp.]